MTTYWIPSKPTKRGWACLVLHCHFKLRRNRTRKGLHPFAHGPDLAL